MLVLLIAQVRYVMTKGDKLFGPKSIWTKIVNTLIYVTGAIAVIMMVIGGMQFSLWW